MGVGTIGGMTRTLSTRAKVILGIVLGLIVLVAGATAGYAAYFTDRALPGVSVAGEPVTGLTRDQVADTVRQRTDGATLTVDVGGTTTSASLSDLGVAVDPQATAAAAFERNGSVVDRLRGLFSHQDAAVVATTDDATLNAFADAVARSAGEPARDASVSLGEDGATFQVTPAVAGVGVDTSAIADAAATAASTLAPQTLTLDVADVQPSVTTEGAQTVADAANAMVALDVTLKGTVSVNTATPQDKASWITFPATASAATDSGGTGAALPGQEEAAAMSGGPGADGAGDGAAAQSGASEGQADADASTPAGLGQPVFDQDKVADWVHRTADSTNDEPVAGIQNVNSRGDVVSTPDQGTPGFTASNTDQLVQETLAALTAGQSYTGQIAYQETDPAFDTRLIADGAENQVYQAAPGEKWIDIDLSTATVSAFEGATIVRGPTPMVPGRPGRETATGTYHVYYKTALQTMRGVEDDGVTPYETPDVPWATYFTGDYAMHGAPWRSSFGWSGPGGSHGCVNMPVSEAKWIYDWAPIGTTVVSHY